MMRRRGGILLGLALAVVAATPSHAFEPATEALLVLYLRVPAPVRTPVSLALDLVEIHGETEDSALPPLFTSLDSGALAGRAPLLVEASVAPGVLDSLGLVWGDAQVQVGPALTRPDLSGTRTVLPLGRRLRAGEVLVLELLWSPDATDPASIPWRPHLELAEPTLPPLGARAYVSLAGSGNVAIVDLTSGRVAGGIGVGGRPFGLAWSRRGQRLYVAVRERDEIVAVELGERELLRRLPLRMGDEPTRVLLTPQEDLLAVVARGRDAVVLLSTSSLQEYGRVHVAPDPVGLTQDPRSGRIFVSAALAGRVEVIDPSTAVVERSIEGLDDPGEIRFLEDLQVLAVSVRGGRRIELVDPNTGVRLEGGLDLCGPVTGMIEHARTRRLFVAQDRCHEIAVLRPDRGIELGRIALDGTPGLLALDGEARELLVPLVELDRLSVFDTNRTRLSWSVEVGRGPCAAVVP